MNKNYRLLSFRSFFIFSFLSFFEGSVVVVLSEGEGGRKYRTPGEFFYIQIFFFTFFLFLKGVSFFFLEGGYGEFSVFKKRGECARHAQNHNYCHLGHVTQMPRTKYCSPYPRRFHIRFGFDRPSGF